MAVRLFAASYVADQSKTFFDNFLLTFASRATIVSLVMVYCTSIDATVIHDISLISSDLAPEGTWM